jgi:rubrerythrin
MATSNENSLKLLATALDMEEKGRAFYDQAVRQSDNEFGREIFGLLRDYEVLHADRIKKIYASMERGGGWTSEWAVVKPIEDLPLIFKKLAEENKDRIRPADSLDAVDIGMGLESESIIFYDRLMMEAVDPQAKKFAEQMVAEEREHYRILADMQAYYADPEAWLMEKERVTLDGA